MSNHWRAKLELSISKGFERISFFPSPMIDNHFRKVHSENIIFVVKVSQGPSFVAPTKDCVAVQLSPGIKYLPLEELYRAMLLGHKMESLDIVTFWTIGLPLAKLVPSEIVFCKQMTKFEWQTKLDELFECFERHALPYYEQNAHDELLLKSAGNPIVGRDGRDLFFKRPLQLYLAGHKAEAIALAENTLKDIESGRVEIKPERYKSFLENLRKAESIMS